MAFVTRSSSPAPPDGMRHAAVAATLGDIVAALA
jgi:hypothetical protein